MMGGVGAGDQPRIFVTGGAGYVGSALIPVLLQRGHDVTVLDLCLYGDDVFALAPEHQRRLRLIRGDIRDASLLRREVAGHDVVIHLACISNDPSFDLDPALGRSVNYEAFQGLLSAIVAGGVSRFVYASTSSVYGARPPGESVSEDSLCEPLTDYSKYKLLCEDELREADLGRCCAVVVRPATVCGYARRLRLDLTVNILTIHALLRNRITVFGGQQLRPHIHIDDMVRAYLTLLDAPEEKVAGRVFNAGYENRSVMSTAEVIRETLGRLGRTRPEIDVQPSNDNRSYHIDSTKIAEELGFQPLRTLEHAVEDLCAAFDQGKIPDAADSPLYYNVKRMKEVSLT